MNLMAENGQSLLGKPKMFFIQTHLGYSVDPDAILITKQISKYLFQ